MGKPRTTLIRSIKPEGQYHAIRFTINGESMTAAWIDTPTTKDFVPLREMTLELDTTRPQKRSRTCRKNYPQEVRGLASIPTLATSQNQRRWPLIKDNLLRLTVFGPSELVTLLANLPSGYSV